MSGSSTTAIENSLISHRLDGSNFKTWKFQLNAILRAKDLEDVVNGTSAKPAVTDAAELKKWLQKDGMAISVLFASLNVDQSRLVLSCKSSKEIMDLLESIHNKKSDVKVMGLYEEYFAVKMMEDEKVAAYVSKVNNLAHELEEQGEKLTDNLKLCRIISGLSSKFSNFRTVWYNIAECRSMDTLLGKLQLEEDSMNKVERESVEAAFSATKFDKSKKKKKSKPDGKSKSTCFSCGEVGHWKKDCLSKGKQSNEKSSKESKGLAFSVIDTVLSARYDDVWIGDSGATQHLTMRKDWLTEFSTAGAQRGVKVANGDLLDVLGTGKVEIEVLVNNRWIKRYLENVRYAPKSSVNLFSIGQLTNKGYTAQFKGKHCIVVDSSNEIVATGMKHDDGLVRMIFRMPENRQLESCFAVTEHISSNSLQQWHRRLGHINIAQIKAMVKKNLVSGIDFTNERDFFCQECQVGKFKRSSHPLTEKRAIEKGECFHIDLCGPMEETGVGGAKYFMALKDEASTFRMVYFIAQKSEVDEKLGEFFDYVENFLNTKVKRIRSDNGTEFTGGSTQKVLSKRGIVMERIAPYTPQQNGMIERENRIIQESARTMLLSSGLNKSLWPEAVRTAVYVLNRSTNSRSPNVTPYEQWFGKKPQLGHLKVFGTIGYAHIPKIHRKKWDPKAKQVFLVGFEPTSKNFRLFDPESKKVFISCDVKFNENFIRSEYLTLAEDETVYDKTKEANEGDLHKPTEKSTTEGESSANDTNHVGDELLTDDDDESVETNEPRKLRQNPKQTDFYRADFALSAISIEPTTYQEAKNSSESNNWMKAIQDELDSLKENDTWDIVDKPSKCRVIGNKWVFKLKTPPNEEPKYKARLVAKGYSQSAGIDYKETFSPVVRYETVRSILAIAAIEDLEMTQFDVKTAFLNGDLEETIYMQVPDGIEHEPNKVCRLKRSLYGLKQASRAWNSKFVEFLRGCDMEQSQADSCLFYGQIDDSRVIVLLYVDDGLILSHSKKAIKSLVTKLSNEFKITLGNGEYYVGMEIKRDRKTKTITITQASYIERIVDKFCMSESNAISTPFDVGTVLTKSEEECELNYPYRQACGSLTYASIIARPDISYAVGEVSKFLENPNRSHINAVKRILRYLNHTKSLGITYGDSDKVSLIGYTDADYARDIDTRRSRTGYAFKIGNGLITWRSQRQETVALSTAEAEFMAVTEGTKEAIWLRQLLMDIGFEQKEATVMRVDNLSAIRLLQNPEFHHRTKHIDVRLFFVRELYRKGKIELEHVASKDQLADVFTKPLAKPIFESIIMRLGMN